MSPLSKSCSARPFWMLGAAVLRIDVPGPWPEYARGPGPFGPRAYLAWPIWAHGQVEPRARLGPGPVLGPRPIWAQGPNLGVHFKKKTKSKQYLFGGPRASFFLGAIFPEGFPGNRGARPSAWSRPRARPRPRAHDGPMGPGPFIWPQALAFLFGGVSMGHCLRGGVYL